MNGFGATLLAWGPRSALGLPGFVEGGLGVAIKALIPVVGYALILPVLWLFFRRTWRELDAEAADYQTQRSLTTDSESLVSSAASLGRSG